jgi:hypothetical protein
MNNRKCPHCGLINFSNAVECKRCKKALDEQSTAIPYEALEAEAKPPEETDDTSHPAGNSVAPERILTPPVEEPLTIQPGAPARYPKRGVGAVVILLLLIASVYGWNYLMLQSPMNEVAREDARNSGISVSTHYSYYLDPSTLVFDLRDVSMTNSKADVFRVLLQYAANMKSRRYDRVNLAFRGETKFILDGEYFQQLGQEYGAQNPVYTMRTFPSHLRRADGSEAYGTWTGGLLGVVGKEIEDFNDFHDQWYLRDMTR